MSIGFLNSKELMSFNKKTFTIEKIMAASDEKIIALSIFSKSATGV
jgi:hypothetical protein